ncbi:hypothetical protein GA0071314_0086 [Halomonas sp. HL-93]|nr:hypothetical protein GA0071314_0086 [Halomonas sp. HL-93]
MAESSTFMMQIAGGILLAYFAGFSFSVSKKLLNMM